MLDDRPRRERGEEGETADDQDDADNEADEQAAGGRKRTRRGGMQFFLGERTRDRHRRYDYEEAADEHRDAAGQVVEWGVAGKAGENRTIIAGLRGVGVQYLGENLRARIGHRSHRRRKDSGA